MDWVFNKCSMERKDDIKSLLIRSFIEAFKLDAGSPRLKEFSVVFNFFFIIIEWFMVDDTANDVTGYS